MGTDDVYSGRSDIRDLGAPVDAAADHADGRVRRRSINPYFAAAWTIACAMTVLGLLWFLFSSPGVVLLDGVTVGAPSRYADYLPETATMTGTPRGPSVQSILSNLTEAGPALLVAGLALSGGLFAVHGVRRANRVG